MDIVHWLDIKKVMESVDDVEIDVLFFLKNKEQKNFCPDLV